MAVPGWCSGGVDVAVIDGTVNGAGRRAAGIGGILKRLQSGNIRSYAAWILVGSVFLLFVMGVMGGLR